MAAAFELPEIRKIIQLRNFWKGSVVSDQPFVAAHRDVALRKFLRDNPILNRLIVVGTKALRRGLVSGETLRAPRQQLRQFAPQPSINFSFLAVTVNLKRALPSAHFFCVVGES
jgi:hypothetical protein